MARLALDQFILWVNAETPYKTAKEYLAAVKERSGKSTQMKMGGTGSAQEDQIITVQLEQALGVKFTYVPFKGGGEVCVNLVGKHVDSTVNNPIECVSHWKAGRVRPLAVFDTERIPVNEWKDIADRQGRARRRHPLPDAARHLRRRPTCPRTPSTGTSACSRRSPRPPEWQKYMDEGALKPRLRDRRRVREVAGRAPRRCTGI